MSTALQRYKYVLILSLAMGLCTVFAIAVLVTSPEKPGIEISDVPFYQLPWGKDKPFYPSNLKTPDGKFASPDAFPSAASCVKCHVEQFEEWAASMHASAGRDKVYDLATEHNVHFKIAGNGPEMGRFCESCHEPAQLIMGRTNRVVSVMPSDAQTEGLTCIICHAVTEALPEKGNCAITVDANKARDNLSNGLIMASPRDHARAFGARATKSLITSSGFCGACHTEIYGPDISQVKGRAHIQTTYTEWKNSWYAENNITCQDCHMNYDPAGYIADIASGKVVKPKKYSHYFVGSNYLMTETALGSNLFFLRGGVLPGLTGKRYLQILDKQKKMTADFLKATARLEIRKSEFTDTGGRLAIAVRNVGAGHNLPTAVTDQKHMWMEVKIVDSTGKTVFHSGAFDDGQGKIAPGSVIWAERFWDDKGNRIMDHLTFNTARIDFTRPLIPAKGEDVVDYDFDLPQNTVGPFKVQAKLWYRVAFQEFVVQMLKTTLTIPPFMLAEVEGVVETPVKVAVK